MASSIKLYPRKNGTETADQSPLPQLLQTPSGLAILELQGTINVPENNEGNTQEVNIGRLVFPDYHPETQDASSTAWMKQIYLYVGEHQRLTGEAKKLPKAMAIIRKRTKSEEDVEMADETSSSSTVEELEVVEIVKYKIVFSQRPEPVGTG
ncbi:hypothetical protein F4813DRAFT_366119 [Daldinia decipiens]|uniref:uncharacterized protein n=1 Tax=Daldinia decipiens TaxID=326647 RepID=UPI0020C3442E|nr:uncharacterized protein F4813DRAFT_366119 [Daldinia decipiens]KAI1655734.1 hypothetical protein F4813DRAFT_366119 [Daldinia decipiens]